MKSMNFFVWQGRSRERSREFGQQAARLRSGTSLQAGVRPARAGGVNSSYSRRVQRGQTEKTRFHGAFMGWDWYEYVRPNTLLKKNRHPFFQGCRMKTGWRMRTTCR